MLVVTDTPMTIGTKNAGAFGLLFLACAVGLIPGVTTEWATVSRSSLATGEWWRLLSHYAIHANTEHLVVNMAGVAALLWLWPNAFGAPYAIVALLSVGTGFGTALMHEGAVYGLSGLLHAFFGYFALSQGFTDRQGLPRYRLVLCFGLVVKVALEAQGLVLPGVAWKAHLAGAFVGLGVSAVAPILGLAAPKNILKQGDA